MNDGRTRLAAYVSGQHTQRESYYGGNGGDPDLTEQARAYYGSTINTIGVLGTQVSVVSAPLAGIDLLAVAGAELTIDDVDDAMPGYGRSIMQTSTDLGAYAQVQIAPGQPLSMPLGPRMDALWINGSYQYQAGSTVPRWWCLPHY